METFYFWALKDVGLQWYKITGLRVREIVGSEASLLCFVMALVSESSSERASTSGEENAGSMLGRVKMIPVANLFDPQHLKASKFFFALALYN